MAPDTERDESTPDTNVETPPETDEEEQLEEEELLPQDVEITDAGPCKKHIKVTVQRDAIDELFEKKYSELATSETSQVRGFRPGKAPRKIIERRFQKEVSDQVRTEVLMASLEQLATEDKVNPLSPPDLDPLAVEIPEEGPLVYEFDVEVRPEFDLPNYKGLKLRRPVHKFSDEEVEREKRRLLEPHGQIVPKPEPVVDLDDIVTADVVMRNGETVLNDLKEVQFRVEKRLALSDGIAPKFLEQIKGAKPGEARKIDIELSQSTANPALRGQTIEGTFTIKDVKTVRLPEMTEDLLMDEYGIDSPELFEELLRTALDRRMEYLQRQSLRQQVLQQLSAGTDWELPQDLVRRQAEQTFRRRILEMRNAGLNEEQISSRLRTLQQDVLRSTEAALVEHFILQKIAEEEKIEIGDDDIDAEIELIAARTDESARRVKARLERDDLIDALATELLERKALDLVLQSAEYEEYELRPEEEEGEAATVEAQAVPGEMQDQTAEVEPEQAEETSEEEK